MVTLRTAPCRQHASNIGIGRFRGRRGEKALVKKPQQHLEAPQSQRIELPKYGFTTPSLLGRSLLQKIALDPRLNFQNHPFQFRTQRQTCYGTWIISAHKGRKELAITFSKIMGNSFVIHNQSGLMTQLQFFDNQGNPIEVHFYEGMYSFKAGTTVQFVYQGETYIWKNMNGDLINMI